jgi:hypothetical protein
MSKKSTPPAPIDDTAILFSRIDKLELSLLEQEHRGVLVFTNLYSAFFDRKGIGKPGQKLAAVKATIFYFLRVTPVVATVGLAGVFGLIIAMRANNLLEEQNRRIDIQNQLIEADRRATLVLEIGNLSQAIAGEFEGAKWTILNLGEKMAYYDKHASATSKAFDRREPDEFLHPLDRVVQTTLSGASSKSELEEREFPFPLSQVTVARIAALTRSLRPYRYIDYNNNESELNAISDGPLAAPAGASENKTPSFWKTTSSAIFPTYNAGPKLVTQPASPERGQLLSILMSSNVHMTPLLEVKCDFSFTVIEDFEITRRNLRRINLRVSRLASITFNECDLLKADLWKADLRGSRFYSSDLLYANFRHANLTDVQFVFSRMPPAEFFSGANMTATSFEYCWVPSRDWLDELEKLAPVGFIRNKWVILSDEPKQFHGEKYWEVISVENLKYR